MKNPFPGWLKAARIYVHRKLASAGFFLWRGLNSRPALKRGLLACGLALPVATAFTFAGFGAAAPAWGLMLACLFLGLGAERHALEWDDVFALPRVRSFAFWHWHALEKKRFIAALGGIAAGTLLPLALGVL